MFLLLLISNPLSKRASMEKEIPIYYMTYYMELVREVDDNWCEENVQCNCETKLP